MGSAAEAVARYGMIRHTSEKCTCAVCVCACSLHRLWDCSVAQHAKLREKGNRENGPRSLNIIDFRNNAHYSRVHSVIRPPPAMLIKRHRRCMSPTHLLTSEEGSEGAVLRSRLRRCGAASLMWGQQSESHRGGNLKSKCRYRGRK